MKQKKNLLQQWVEKAENDFKVARHGFRAKQDAFNDAVCFHAQQSGEKFIKAVLTRLGILFPRSHDIGELIELLPEWARPPIDASESEVLSGYAVDSRYPGLEANLTRRDCSLAINISEKIRKWARGSLSRKAKT